MGTTDSTPAPALSYDEILEQGVRAEAMVPLCLNGRLRRQYEEVKARVDERTAEHEAEREAARLVLKAKAHAAARAAAEANGDDRLVSKPAAAEPDPEDAEDAPYVDPEQGELDRLRAAMLRFTVPFIIQGVPEGEWNQLLEAHPPRKDPADAKKTDPRDWEGVNAATFYTDLVRRSIVEPPHTDEQFAKLMDLVTSAQFDRLGNAAAEVNKKDEDLPFSLGDLESRRL